MTGDKSKFLSIFFKQEGHVTYGDNNGKESLGKFDEKADLGIFIGYSLTSHAYRVYNKMLMTVEESDHVVFDEVDRRISQIPKTSAEEDE